MTLWETDPQAISDIDTDALSEADWHLVSEADADISENPKAIQYDPSPGPTYSIKRRRRHIVGLGLILSGLLLGWLVIGWWLWPVQWINTFPWDLRSDYQRTFVELVAKDYWQSSDVSQARQALSGWEEEALAQLLATMRAQAPNFETRQRLAALVEALQLPDYRVSPLTALLGQRAIVLSTLLSMSPLALAVVLAVSPLVRDKANKSKRLGKLVGPGVEEAMGHGEFYEGTMAGESPDQAAEEAAQETEEATGVAPGETDEEDEEEDEEDWWEEDEEEDVNASVGDILKSIFEEEASDLPQLEALAKDLPDIKIDDLLEKGRRLATRLQKSNTLRTASEG